MTATAVTPVTVLTGFLGSGKSTLLNRILRHPSFADSAVLVNEFGTIPIDHALVRAASETLVVLPSGCVCCQVAGDLVQAMRELHFRRAAGEVPPFRRAIIETTGLADPAPLLRTLIEMPLVAARYALSGVITTVDGVHGAAQLDQFPEAVKQAAVADRIVMTKSDLASKAGILALDERLAVLNPGARRVRSTLGEVDPLTLFDTGLYRAAGVPDAAGWLNAGAYRHAGAVFGAQGHDARIRSFVWTTTTPVTWPALEDALDTLLGIAGERILRVKGLVNVAAEAAPWAIHAVQHSLYPPARLPSWPDEDRRTRLVFIVRDLEETFVAQTLESFLGQSEMGSDSIAINPRNPSQRAGKIGLNGA